VFVAISRSTSRSNSWIIGSFVSGANCTTFNEGGGFARSDYVRISGSSSLAGQQEYSVLAGWHSGAGDGAEDGRVDDPAIEDAVSSADDGLAITRQLIGGSNARTKVRAVGRQGSGAGQKRIGNLRGWQELGIPAQAEASASGEAGFASRPVQKMPDHSLRTEIQASRTPERNLRSRELEREWCRWSGRMEWWLRSLAERNR